MTERAPQDRRTARTRERRDSSSRHEQTTSSDTACRTQDSTSRTRKGVSSRVWPTLAARPESTYLVDESACGDQWDAIPDKALTGTGDIFEPTPREKPIRPLRSCVQAIEDIT